LKPEFTITNAVHGSTNVTIKPGTTASLLPGSKLSIAGLTYEVGTSNDTCSVTCITLSTDYKGPNILDANTHIPGFYNQEIYAITTSDLTSILSESLGVEVQIGNDFFEVKGVSNSGLILSEKVTTSSDISHSIFVDGNGAEQSIIMKTITSDLDTFQVIPNSNWRGTNSRIYTMRTGGSGPHQYILGNKIEEQVLIFLDKTLSAGKTFILAFEIISSTFIQNML